MERNDWNYLAAERRVLGHAHHPHSSAARVPRQTSTPWDYRRCLGTHGLGQPMHRRRGPPQGSNPLAGTSRIVRVGKPRSIGKMEQ